MPDREDDDAGDVNERQRALLSNLAAVRAVTGAIEGTLGPNGLDCLLVDENGQVVLTNDGVTILQHLEVTHPAARLLIQAAKAQERAVGDGTTTATILAGAFIAEGANQILRGVPATRVIEGIGVGLDTARTALARLRRPVAGLDDPVLPSVALVAGRGDTGLAAAVLGAARQLGEARMLDPGASLAASVVGLEGATDAAIRGLIVEREPLVPEMPARLVEARVLVVDGALEPEPLPVEALTSAAGLARVEAGRAAFRVQLDRLAEAGITFVLASRGIADIAAQFFVDRGILGLRRVSERDLARVASFTGARILRHASWPVQVELSALAGRVSLVEVDREARLVRLAGGDGQAEVTIVIGGSTSEVVAERERIARDAASSLQHALRGGVVPGGGAAELALARALAQTGTCGMSSYGIACVREALKRPLAQLAANAGYNPLEKVEEAYAAQERTGLPGLGIEAATGQVRDLTEAGIWDPYPVKEYALRTAGEVARAILRITSILRMKPGASDGDGWHDPA